MKSFTYNFDTDKTVKIMEKHVIGDGYVWEDTELLDTIIDVKFSGNNGELPTGFLSNQLEIEFNTLEMSQDLFDILLENYTVDELLLLKFNAYTTVQYYEQNQLKFIGVLSDEGQISEIGLYNENTIKIKFKDIIKDVCEQIKPSSIATVGVVQNMLVNYNDIYALVYDKGSNDINYVFENLGRLCKYISFPNFVKSIIDTIYGYIAFEYYGYAGYSLDVSGNLPIPYFYKNTESTADCQTDVRGDLISDQAGLYLIYETPDNAGTDYNIFNYIESKYKNLYDFLYDYSSGFLGNIQIHYQTTLGQNEVELIPNLLFELDSVKHLENIEIKNVNLRELFYDRNNIVFNVHENADDLNNVKTGIKGTLSNDEFTINLNYPSKLGAYGSVNQKERVVWTKFNWLGFYYLSDGLSTLIKVNDKVQLKTGEDYYIENDYRNIDKLADFNFTDYQDEKSGKLKTGIWEYQRNQGIAEVLKLASFYLINNKYNVVFDVTSYNDIWNQLYLTKIFTFDILALDSKFINYFTDNIYFLNEYNYSFVTKKLELKLSGFKLP